MIIDPSDATLAWWGSYPPLTTAATDGICLAGELPSGIQPDQDSPDLVVLQLAPSIDDEVPIYEAVFLTRFYGKSLRAAFDLYRHAYALVYDQYGLLAPLRIIENTWTLIGATLSKPDQFEEDTGWKGYEATLRTRWHLMEKV